LVEDPRAGTLRRDEVVGSLEVEPVVRLRVGVSVGFKRIFGPMALAAKDAVARFASRLVLNDRDFPAIDSERELVSRSRRCNVV
jgi:hypothetical protein